MRARFLAAQGQAKAIETTFAAIHNSRPDPALLAYQYLQVLPQIAQGDANKMWIIPSEFTKALEGLSRMAGADADGELPAWLKAGEGATGDGSQSIDTSDWFTSQLADAISEPTEAALEESPAEINPTELPSIPSRPSSPSPCRHAPHRPAASEQSAAQPRRRNGPRCRRPRRRSSPPSSSRRSSPPSSNRRRRSPTRSPQVSSRSTRPTDRARVTARHRRARRGSRSGRFGAPNRLEPRHGPGEQAGTKHGVGSRHSAWDQLVDQAGGVLRPQ